MVVHHFGPDPASVGGIATVIRLLTEYQVGGDTVNYCPTWRPRSRRDTAHLAVGSMRALTKIAAGDVAHIHLSERGSFLREGSLVALAHQRGLVTVVTVHGASFLPFADRHVTLVSAVLRRADLVTCMDQDALDFVRQRAPRVYSEIVPNPVLIDTSARSADQTDELVVFAGEIGLRKGADVMHRAWCRVAQQRPEAHCLMVGPVTDFAPPATERLELRSTVSPNEMEEILRTARVVALPARAEGMPMILAEAMGLGRPFVSTPVGGIPDLALGGGFLVPVEDDVRLADRLTDLLADPNLARIIGERGQRYCLETRSVAVIDARLRELYVRAKLQKEPIASENADGKSH